MEAMIIPAENSPKPANTETPAEEPVTIIHDGSGGAFEGTETVSEEQEEGPEREKPRPY
ncbi:hypothetical protein [Chitinophaga qingshengii]|uniref:Uncharacterized protein n=1 Tax=Chitinophaga qingshengii TaxID=1569794 RepID=A0ABR7TVL4_9BACT|nr:hypothetical protein [Chitinophaga qingshengii]MBC9934095.1 hypothetical protein [Chitinophaga qingshengii]